MKWRYLLFPFALLYGTIAALRRWFYRSGVCKSYHSVIPTIVVGNLRVGGTGKTPHTEYLLALTKEWGRSALVSRGYGRKTKGFLLANNLSEEQQTARNIGDEPMQILRKFPTTIVAVSEKRAIALKELEKLTPPIQLAVLDDAFQHLPIAAGLKIVLTEYADPYYADLPLPAGNLREFASAAKSADIIIVTKSPENLLRDEADKIKEKLRLAKKQHCFYTRYIYNNINPQNRKAENIQISSSTPALLLTGIANPKPMIRYLSEQFTLIEHLEYRDHYDFKLHDLEKIKRGYEKLGEQAIMVTTEKDYARLQSSAISKEMDQFPIFVLPVRIDFLFDEKKNFNTIIEDYVRKNTKNS
ncbi:tetraacyldisaccharide 4'-kinase [Bacteroidales bacterium OttesenSCG-928-B11]|nr:tetraacyldisaccharide 4'-kinase [Bacteroidales bacterium OttesenSCG-928-B11]MDL2325736.1 tetraacyldisaccharide 4'-kinase [Bacteroidales bacterium OttesenSCG-928-A14]